MNFSRLIEAKDLDEIDFLISQELKQNVPLYMLADKTYGELVSYRIMTQELNHTSNFEFYRIIENFHLWTNRYIQPQVMFTVLLTIKPMILQTLYVLVKPLGTLKKDTVQGKL